MSFVPTLEDNEQQLSICTRLKCSDSFSVLFQSASPAGETLFILIKEEVLSPWYWKSILIHYQHITKK